MQPLFKVGETLPEALFSSSKPDLGLQTDQLFLNTESYVPETFFSPRVQ